MIHPLLHLLATQPHLVGEHLEAYAHLVGEDVGKASTAWVWRLVYWVAALVLVGVGVVLAGIALMLWGSAVPDNLQAPWLLIVVPCVPFVIAVVCILMARGKAQHRPFDNLKKQFSADVEMLRDVGATT